MPPKKGSSKKPEKSRTPILIDGLTKDEISKEQLEDHIMRLREELDREREERNYFQLERDRVQAFQGITHRKLEVARAELQNLDKELEETEIKLQVDKKVYRQKMRHLLCEHLNTVCEINADSTTSYEAMQEEQKKVKNGLRHDVASLLVDLHQVDIETSILELKEQHQEEMANLKEISEKKLQDVEAKYEQMLRERKQDHHTHMRNSIQEVSEKWTDSISDHVQQNEAAYEDAQAVFKILEKKYDSFSEIKQNIEDQASALKEEKQILSQTLQENHQLRENLILKQDEMIQFQKKLRFKPKTFDNKKETELRKLACEHETLEKRFKELQIELVELQRMSAGTLEEMRNKSNAKVREMEKKIQHLSYAIKENLLNFKE